MSRDDLASGSCVVAVDVGSTSTKASVFRVVSVATSTRSNEAATGGKTLLRLFPTHTSESSRHYATSAREPYTQRRDGWVAAVRDVVGDVVGRCGGDGVRVDAVVLSGQMQALVGLERDEDEEAVVFSDTAYAAEEAERLRANGAAEWLQRETGNFKGPASLAAKLLKRQAATTGKRKRGGVVFSAHAFVAFALTGRNPDSAACDPTTASTTGLVSRTTGTWLSSAELESRVGIHSTIIRLPTLLSSAATVVGTIQRDPWDGWTPPAALLGVPVVHGSGDVGSVALGAGVLLGNQSAPHLYIGTSGWIAASVPRAVASSRGGERGFPLAHPLQASSRVVLAAPTTSTGENAAMWTRALGCASLAAFDALAQNVLDSPDAARLVARVPLFYPYPRGERFPQEWPTARAALVDLDPDAFANRGLVALAVLSGVAFHFRLMMDTVPAIDADTLALVGGGSHSKTWAIVLAAVLNRSVVRSARDVDVAVLGAACVGLHALSASDALDVRLANSDSESAGSAVETSLPPPKGSPLADAWAASYARWLRRRADVFAVQRPPLQPAL